MPGDDHESLSAPPRTSVDDPGAHELDSDSSGSEDHFSDAHSGRNSPIPITRVEKVDTDPSYGEVPGTDAYNLRTEDARPDEIAVFPDSSSPKTGSATDRPSTPGGYPIPTTIVEKIDSSLPSYGEVPGTTAHKTHAADAVPDIITNISEPGSKAGTPSRLRSGSTPGDLPIPITRVEKIDSSPSHGEVPGTKAYELRKGDAEPDIIEEVGDIPGSPTSPAARSSTLKHLRRKSSAARKPDAKADDDEEDIEENGFGDDFDDFEEGGEDADFDDFEDGFQEPEAVSSPPIQSLPPTIAPLFPVLNFDDLDTPDEVLAATAPYIEALFPDTIDTSMVPSPSASNPIFLTQRSASLWSQLVAPPPLQPPNWIRSRIRRLFLVSLGVPVDLDEILPASKQKKLILPSTRLHPNDSNTSPRTSTNITRLKNTSDNASNTSLDSQNNPKPSSKRRKGPPPAPELDLVSARQLCTITDEALNGLTDEELGAHVKKLEAMQGIAEEVLAYWTKRTDEKIGDREAFEGVIENLVKHARKTRK